MVQEEGYDALDEKRILLEAAVPAESEEQQDQKCSKRLFVFGFFLVFLWMTFDAVVPPRYWTLDRTNHVEYEALNKAIQVDANASRKTVPKLEALGNDIATVKAMLTDLGVRLESNRIANDAKLNALNQSITAKLNTLNHSIATLTTTDNQGFDLLDMELIKALELGQPQPQMTETIQTTKCLHWWQFCK